MAEQKNEQERARLRDGDWITIIDEDTFGGLGSSTVAMLTAEQRKRLDEGAEPDEFDDLEMYPVEDLVKWAIANGYFDYPPDERAVNQNE